MAELAGKKIIEINEKYIRSYNCDCGNTIEISITKCPVSGLSTIS